MFEKINYQCYPTKDAAVYHVVQIESWRLRLDMANEKALVVDALWDSLMANEKDVEGYDTNRESGSARMLRKLCASVPGGASVVKQKLMNSITYKRLEEQ